MAFPRQASTTAGRFRRTPDAGHSFLNNHQDVFFKMMRVVGVGYHEPSATDARRRIAAFFKTHLT